MDPIVKSVTVNCSAEHAFNVFVHRIGTWWPLDSHAVSANQGERAQDVTIEPRVGGAIIETMHNGTNTEWGTVQAYEPGQRFATTWHPGTGKDKPTLVEVEFTQQGDTTLVTLTHSGWEIWKDEAADKITGYTAGWGAIMDRMYGPACATP